MMHNFKAYYLMIAIASPLLFVHIMAEFRVYLQDRREMKYIAVSQIIGESLSTLVFISVSELQNKN